MKVTLNGGWHLWIANFAHNRVNRHSGTDICTYTRAFLSGLFWLFVVSLFSAAGASWVLYTIYNIFDSIFGAGRIEPPTVILLLVVAAIGMTIAVMMFREWLSERTRQIHEAGGQTICDKAAQTFVGSAYRKFKDKTCFRIEFRE